MDSDESTDAKNLAAKTGAQLEDAVEKIISKVDSEQAHREMFIHALFAAKNESREDELRCLLDSMPEMGLSLRSSRDYLEELELVGALESDVEHEDSNKGEGNQGNGLSEGLRTWRLTEAGTVALEAISPLRRFEFLLAEEPGEEKVFRWILDFCESPRKRFEIEMRLRWRRAFLAERASRSRTTSIAWSDAE